VVAAVLLLEEERREEQEREFPDYSDASQVCAVYWLNQVMQVIISFSRLNLLD
jgi:hypothetical protein